MPSFKSSKATSGDDFFARSRRLDASSTAASVAQDFELLVIQVARRARIDDKAAGLMVERCQQLIAEPPKNWDGVWTGEMTLGNDHNCKAAPG